MPFVRSVLAGLMLATALAGCGPQTGDEGAVALSTEEFYRGKTIWLVVGFSPGGGHDISSRVLARYLNKYIPGAPEIVVQNMPGAGSLTAANYVYNVAPKDGTYIGTFVDAIPLAPLWGMEGVRFDTREVGWLGSMTSKNPSVIIVRSDSPATTIEEAREKPVTIAASSTTSTTSAFPLLLNEILGTKFEVIIGYPGITEMHLAMERNEAHGRAGDNWNVLLGEKPDWKEHNFIAPLVQLTRERHSTLPDIPTVYEFVENEEDLAVMHLVFDGMEFTRLYSVAPGVPPERLAILRQAFAASMADPGLAVDLKRATGRDLDASLHEEIEDYVQSVFDAPEHAVERARQFISSSE